MATVSAIKGCPLFYELYDEEIQVVLDKSIVVSYNSGDSIVKENEEGKEFFIILSGEVNVTKEVDGQDMHLSTFRKGDVFGEAILLNEKKNFTSISAATNCDLLAVNLETVLSMYKSKPEIFGVLILNVARLLAKRLRKFNMAVANIHSSFKKAS